MRSVTTFRKSAQWMRHSNAPIPLTLRLSRPLLPPPSLSLSKWSTLTFFWITSSSVSRWSLSNITSERFPSIWIASATPQVCEWLSKWIASNRNDWVSFAYIGYIQGKYSFWCTFLFNFGVLGTPFFGWMMKNGFDFLKVSFFAWLFADPQAMRIFTFSSISPVCDSLFFISSIIIESIDDYLSFSLSSVISLPSLICS